jgi:hypothetical protein
MPLSGAAGLSATVSDYTNTDMNECRRKVSHAVLSFLHEVARGRMAARGVLENKCQQGASNI